VLSGRKRGRGSRVTEQFRERDSWRQRSRLPQLRDQTMAGSGVWSCHREIGEGRERLTSGVHMLEKRGPLMTGAALSVRGKGGRETGCCGCPCWAKGLVPAKAREMEKGTRGTVRAGLCGALRPMRVKGRSGPSRTAKRRGRGFEPEGLFYLRITFSIF
jgi:hypothetical protein